MVRTLDATNGRRFLTGNGTPEGSVTGSVGDFYTDRGGAAGSTMYIKQSGNATNTGWFAVDPGTGPAVNLWYIPAVNWIGVPALVPTLSTRQIGVMALRVQQFAANDAACVTFAVPDNWNLGNVFAKIYWSSQNANHGARTWQVGCNCISNAESIPGTISAVNATGTDTAIDVLYETAEVTVTPGGVTPAAADLLHFYLTRAVDGILSTINFIGMRIRYGTT